MKMMCQKVTEKQFISIVSDLHQQTPQQIPRLWYEGAKGGRAIFCSEFLTHINS